jgi:hypothetical protein
MATAKRLGKQDLELLPDQLASSVAEHRLQSGVREGDAALAVHGEDPLGGRFEKSGGQGLASTNCPAADW